jgi:hypothetical protein
MINMIHYQSIEHCFRKDVTDSVNFHPSDEDDAMAGSDVLMLLRPVLTPITLSI